VLSCKINYSLWFCFLFCIGMRWTLTNACQQMCIENLHRCNTKCVTPLHLSCLCLPACLLENQTSFVWFVRLMPHKWSSQSMIHVCDSSIRSAFFAIFAIFVFVYFDLCVSFRTHAFSNLFPSQFYFVCDIFSKDEAQWNSGCTTTRRREDVARRHRATQSRRWIKSVEFQ
jgi:hypothetical protein